MKGKLILEDGTTFRGQLFGGSNATTEGEVVFNTGMTGYRDADLSSNRQLRHGETIQSESEKFCRRLGSRRNLRKAFKLVYAEDFGGIFDGGENRLPV